MNEFIQLKRRKTNILKKSAVSFIRKQNDGTWIIGDSVYINREGKEISLDECEGIWISHVFKGSGVPNCDASCIISMPLSTEPLNSFLFKIAETIIDCYGLYGHGSSLPTVH
jgi:hypothetical protein